MAYLNILLQRKHGRFEMKKKLINWLCLSGIVSALFYLLHDIVGAQYYPGYDWMKQAVSDLTAADAPSAAVAGGLAQVYGIFAILCCALMCILIQDCASRSLRIGVYTFAIMNVISGVGYSIFPLSTEGYAGTFQDVMHVYVVTALVVISSIIALVLIAIGGFKEKNQYSSLAIWAVIALIFMFAGPIGINAMPKTYFGVVERFSTYSAVIFNAVLGVYGFKQIR